MAELQKAEASPRFENNTLKWYEGDTFDVNMNIKIVDVTDPDRGAKRISGDEGIIFEIKNSKKKELFTMVVDAADIGYDTTTDSNIVIFKIDDTVTKKLSAGTYYYDVVYSRENAKTTISRSNKIVVE